MGSERCIIPTSSREQQIVCWFRTSETSGSHAEFGKVLVRGHEVQALVWPETVMVVSAERTPFFIAARHAQNSGPDRCRSRDMPKQRRNPKQWQAILADYERSGLSAEALFVFWSRRRCSSSRRPSSTFDILRMGARPTTQLWRVTACRDILVGHGCRVALC